MGKEKLNLFYYFAYLKYLFLAQGRHGTHSPFVYQLIENFLRKNKCTDWTGSLEGFLTHYLIVNGSVESFIFPLKNIQNNTVFLCKDIYKNKSSAKMWEKISNDESVTMSIDLFDFGLVFFDKSFLVKQHFIIK